MASDRADLVVVGAGTIGGWASYFARLGGAERVIVLERGRAGDGASSRAAGTVRAQGGTPTTVVIGRWRIDFYRGQQARLGADSGFRELGYLILANSREDVQAGRERVAMQRRAGIDVRWLEPEEATQFDPWLAPASFRGASYPATDGCVDPPRKVHACSLADLGLDRFDQLGRSRIPTDPIALPFPPTTTDEVIPAHADRNSGGGGRRS